MDKMVRASILRRLRIQARLTQADLAAKVGCSVDAVACWEAGRRKPNARNLERLCVALGLID